MMRPKICVTAFFISFLIGTLAMAADNDLRALPDYRHPAIDVYDGWRLGMQVWSFRRFTLFEAIEKTRQLGLYWLEAFPGQKIKPDSDMTFGPQMTAQQRQAILDKLAEEGVRLAAFGVVDIPEAAEQAEALFAFAKQMGIETIAAEPKPEQLDLLDALCQKYQVKLAIHNHPKDSFYWHPQTVLDVCKGRSRWIGACADVGHWVRSGLDPVECLKQLSGRIHTLHIKEVDSQTNGDVVWGLGQNRIPAILKQLHQQGFEGLLSIEYEAEWDDNLPSIRRSVDYYIQIANGLKPTGWRPLFKGDLSNAVIEQSGWEFVDGVLMRVGDGDIWTKEVWKNFVLDVEFRVGPKANSGIFIRAANRQWLPWIELQIEDSFGKPLSNHICGAIFDIQAPAVNAVKPAGQWNRLTLTANGKKIYAILNNTPILDADLSRWTQAGKNPDGLPNKFNIAYNDLPQEGFIGFQDHRDGTRVDFRNIWIKPLP